MGWEAARALPWVRRTIVVAATRTVGPRARTSGARLPRPRSLLFASSRTPLDASVAWPWRVYFETSSIDRLAHIVGRMLDHEGHTATRGRLRFV